MQINRSYDVIVLGTGGIGSAALLQLAQQGVRALGIDQFAMAHQHGSSHGETRVIRKAYFEHPDYVPLLQRAYELWQQLDQQYQQSEHSHLYIASGALSMGAPDGEIIQGIRHAAATHDLAIEELSRADMMHQFPGLKTHEQHIGILEAEAGYLMVERAISHQLTAAMQAGADYLPDSKVNGWHIDDAGAVVVSTDRHVFHADRLIITAGAWAAQQLPQLQSHLTVLRKHLHWFANQDPRYQQPHLPVFFFELAQGLFYGFPQIDGAGVKISNHAGGEVIDDPLELERQPDPDDLTLIRSFLSNHLPGVSLQQTRHDVCMYTQSPDGHFIIDQHPQHRNVVYTAGLSGHGFKFATVLGEIMVQLALDGHTPLPIHFLRADRLH